MTIPTAQERSLAALGMTPSFGPRKPCHPEPKAPALSDAEGRDLFSTAAAALCLAATPTFALMALLTAVMSGGGQDMLCGQMASPIGGMTLMYLLMSAFHAAPWLRRILERKQRTSSERATPVAQSSDRYTA